MKFSNCNAPIRGAREIRPLKVLITGFTRQHAGRPHATGYLTTPSLVSGALRSLGHHVDHRALAFGEDVSRYDALLIFVTHPESPNAEHILPALEALRRRPGAIVGVDDSKVRHTLGGMVRVITGKANLARSKIFQRRYADEARPYFKNFISVLGDIVQGKRFRVLAPLFPWGDRERLGLPNLNLLRWFDPSPLVEPLYRDLIRKPDRQRERCWAFASLTDQMKWLKRQRLTWPVEAYACGRQRLPRLNEIDLVRRYGEVEGMLCFRQPVSGSGWFRLRYPQSALMECVLAGDPAETAAIGDPYRFTPTEVERLSPDRRRSLAREQAKLFFERSATLTQTLDRLDSIIRENHQGGQAVNHR
jgi:hypothetical protein